MPLLSSRALDEDELELLELELLELELLELELLELELLALELLALELLALALLALELLALELLALEGPWSPARARSPRAAMKARTRPTNMTSGAGGDGAASISAWSPAGAARTGSGCTPVSRRGPARRRP